MSIQDIAAWLIVIVLGGGLAICALVLIVCLSSWFILRTLQFFRGTNRAIRDVREARQEFKSLPEMVKSAGLWPEQHRSKLNRDLS